MTTFPGLSPKRKPQKYFLEKSNDTQIAVVAQVTGIWIYDYDNTLQTVTHESATKYRYFGLGESKRFNNQTNDDDVYDWRCCNRNYKAGRHYIVLHVVGHFSIRPICRTREVR